MIHSIWTWITIATILITIMKMKKMKKLPPSPKGLPIIGHLHLIGKNPHQDLHNLANKHGPIMYLKFGFIDNIIVSSASEAERFLKTNDAVFAGRPPIQAMKYMLYDQQNFSFAQYGPYWRSMRKLCIQGLLSNNKIKSYNSMRKKELGFLVNSLKQHVDLHQANTKFNGIHKPSLLHVDPSLPTAVDLSDSVFYLIADMNSLMIFGKKYYTSCEFNGRQGFKDVVHDANKLVLTPNWGDLFPFLRRFDFQGIVKRSKEIGKVLDELLEKTISDHENRNENEEKNEGHIDDLTSTFLAIWKYGKMNFEFEFDRRQVKAILLDMLMASVDGTATVVEWALSELLKHPKVMKTLQNELEKKVGLYREVEESDLDNLKYLEMVIKEVLRLHPPTPLLLPHEALEDCTIESFHIPEKSRVIINAWAIGRDPNTWSDPNEFKPERFLSNNIDVKGQHFELIPFGSGRRGCPGMQLGLIIVKLLVAQLVHCFDWELPTNMLPSELDMSENFSLVTSKAIHLMAIPTYRLQK